jgi:tripartite-type tricarboxylate transporter receptor subunit TctC
MSGSRRKKVSSRSIQAALVAIVLCGSNPGLTQTYPAKPIRLVVGFQPGGGVDLSARIVGRQLTDSLGQSLIIDNKAGASGNIASTFVAKAAPDGYTLLMAQSSIAMPGLFTNLPFNVSKDFDPISLIAIGPAVLVVPPSLPVRNMSELIKLAKSKPRQLVYGSGGIGNITHLQMELLTAMTGIELTHVPYKGSAPGVIALVSGEIQMLFASIPSALPHIKAERIRPIAVSTAKRSSALPNIPSLDEGGLKGYDTATWYGLFAPANTPAAARALLSREIVKTMRAPDVNEKFMNDGFEPVGNGAEEFSKFLRSELVKWAKVIKAADIKAE